MSTSTTEFMRAVCRCVGTGDVPAEQDIAMVATKIWQDITIAGAGTPAMLPASLDHIFYRRAARLALEGRSSAH